VTFEFRGPAELAERLREVVIASTQLPAGYTVLADVGAVAVEGGRQLWLVVALATAFVFILSVALFESVRQPICVLSAAPLSLVGVMVAFVLANERFTREAAVGAILSAGLAVNGSILVVDRINQLRRGAGLGVTDLVRRAAAERVRPILMTGAITVCGILGPGVGRASGASAWDAMGLAIAGGVFGATLLVPAVVPALYLLLEGRAARRASVAAQTGGGAITFDHGRTSKVARRP
jgi:HAE1 family hydrophobic/amphiphilic exporter-1